VEQRAEVASAFVRSGDRVVFLGNDPGWFVRRLCEDGRGSADAYSGSPQCGAEATVLSGSRTLCLYDNRTLSGQQRSAALAAHTDALVAPAIFDDQILRITRRGDLLHLAGEVDISNRHALTDAMRSAAQPLTLDVASLRFIDAGGVAAMYSAAAGGVRLRRPQPVPRKVIELFDPTAERLVCEGVTRG
jgi:ABC-type transporter Mla MlaB component